ncbi:MAG: site-specific DNA-methyltransferase, partial [Clostridia bacterium]|nr:site-specific DNA-methyltransferase [Clostridia bacterium]
MKSERNKTIDFGLEEGEKYLSKCVPAEEYETGTTDVTILGDAFSATGRIADRSVDLLIVDPPYNMNKNFHGGIFKKTDDTVYSEYTEKWITAVKPKLKDTASVYVCCDWESSIVVGAVLKKHFILRNRITWEREKGRGAKANWKNSMEDIFFATVGEEYFFDLDAVKIRKRVLAPYKKDGEPKDWREIEDGKFRDTCPSNFWDD